MSDPSPDGRRPGGWVPPPADATRDITLPPMADRPGPAVRPEWASYLPAEPQAAPIPPAPSPPAEQPRRPHDPPTDRLAARPDTARSRTLAFEPPPQVQLLKVSVGATPRRGRWLWALVILIPLAVIIGSGVWLLMLFYGG